MSRRVAALSMLLAATAAPAIAQESDTMATYRERTQAGIICRDTAEDDEIVVCGRRAADRYRTPIVQREAGDPAIQDVPAERQRLLEDTSFECSVTGPFFARCGGMVGVSASTAIGPGGGKAELRKPAP